MSLGNNSVNHNDSFYYSYSCCDHHRLILVLVIWFSILLFIISVFLLSSSSSSSATTSNKNDTSTTGSVVPMNTTKRDKNHSAFDCNDIDDTSNVTADTSLFDEVYEVSGTMSSITSDNGFVNKETIRSSMSLSSSIGQEIQNTIDVSLDELFMKQQQQQHDKHDSSSCTVQKPFLVHNGELKLHIRNGRLEDAIERIQHLVQDDKKGYIETKTVYTIGDYNANDNFQPTPLQLYGTFLTIRIQNDDYFSVFRHVQKNLFNDDDEIQFGLRVIQYTTNTKDVTDKYIDASARANVLHVSREALLRQLVFINNNNNNASTTTNSNFDAITTVSDVLYIQSEINQLTEQIESQRLRAKYYEKQSVCAMYKQKDYLY